MAAQGQSLKQVDYDVPQQRLSMGLIHVNAGQRLVLAYFTYMCFTRLMPGPYVIPAFLLPVRQMPLSLIHESLSHGR